MAQPLTWNSPGATWNAPGATWNGSAASPKTMNKTKAIIDFSSYAGPALGPVAQTIHDHLTTNAAHFATPPTSMAALQTQIATFQQKLAAKASRATADVIAFEVARNALEGVLADLGGYVNLVAKGDLTLVSESGFPSYATGQPGLSGPPAAPTDLRLRHGDLSGSIVARYHPDRPRSMNVVEINPGDPNHEPGWTHAGMFSGGKATIGSLTVGSTVWVRVCTAGSAGVMGAWSDPAKIVVI